MVHVKWKIFILVCRIILNSKKWIVVTIKVSVLYILNNKYRLYSQTPLIYTSSLFTRMTFMFHISFCYFYSKSMYIYIFTYTLVLYVFSKSNFLHFMFFDFFFTFFSSINKLKIWVHIFIQKWENINGMKAINSTFLHKRSYYFESEFS